MNHILPHRGSHPYRIDPTQPYKTFAFEENDAKRMCSLHDSLGGSMMCGKICMYRVRLDINPNCNFFKALYSRYSVAARTAANGNRQPHLTLQLHTRPIPIFIGQITREFMLTNMNQKKQITALDGTEMDTWQPSYVAFKATAE